MEDGLEISVRISPTWARRLTAVAALAAVAVPASLFAGGFLVPHQFANGTATDATTMNANFTAIATAIDGLQVAANQPDSLVYAADNANHSGTFTARRAFVDSDVQATVPSDGTYLVMFQSRLYNMDCAGPDGWWKARVADVATGAEIVDAFGINCGNVAINADTTTTGFKVLSLTAGQLLRLQYWVEGSGTTTITMADSNGGQSIALIRLGD
jgi:hypothetical protein